MLTAMRSTSSRRPSSSQKLKRRAMQSEVALKPSAIPVPHRPHVDINCGSCERGFETELSRISTYVRRWARAHRVDAHITLAPTAPSKHRWLTTDPWPMPPATWRTFCLLDIGATSSPSATPASQPHLGWRGARLLLDRPAIWRLNSMPSSSYRAIIPPRIQIDAAHGSARRMARFSAHPSTRMDHLDRIGISYDPDIKSGMIECHRHHIGSYTRQTCRFPEPWHQ